MPDFNPIASLTPMLINIVMWIVPILIGIFAFRELLPQLKGVVGEVAVGKSLEALFGEVLHDIIVPDGRGGLTQIDHVVLTGDGLLVVETKNYRGAIFGTDRDAKWTQRLGGRSYRFQSPLRQNYLHTQALQALQLGVPVRGHVVFTDSSKFPNGIPGGVSLLSNLRQDLGSLVADAAIPVTYTSAWKHLKQNVRTDKLARKEHLSAIREKRGGSLGVRTAGILLSLSSACLVVLIVRFDLPFNLLSLPVSTHEQTMPTTVRSFPKPLLEQNASAPKARYQQGGYPPTAEIAWSTQKRSQHAECNLATATVLIENSAENRKQRDLACTDNN